MGSSPIASIFLFMKSGALAQLGARNIRIVEVTGSNPVYSIFLFPYITPQVQYFQGIAEFTIVEHIFFLAKKTYSYVTRCNTK